MPRPVTARFGLGCLMLAAPLGCAAGATKPQPPLDLGSKVAVVGAPNYVSASVRLPDDTLESYLTDARLGERGKSVNPTSVEGRTSILRVRSADSGRTWSEPQTVLVLPVRKWGGPIPLLDRDGEVHLVLQGFRGEGRLNNVDRFVDLYHVRSFDGRTRWSEPQRIYAGYVGSIQGLVQLRSGRMVAPFAEWRAGVAVAPPTGPSATTVVTSDDGGKTWLLSASKLTAPCREGYNGNNYGACEPSLLELNDGRTWMLLRTQAGFLYESFSRDGVTWPEARPSHFYSSNSPAFPVRLPDGRIVLFWNNCEMPPRTGQSLVYGGRDALHAALSADEGRTWRGYREVYRDPARNATPPRSGDRGTAYPHATVTADGRVLLVSGQGEDRRRRLLIDPDWLLEKEQEERFSDLDGWHVFKGFGPAAVRSWRDREPGARLIAHPDRASEKVLHVRRPEKREADGAVWNFPNGRRGRLTLRIRCQPGFAGAQIGLTDRMFEPCDDHGEKLAAVVLALDAAGSSAGARMVTPGRWQTLEFVWDVAAGHCKVTVDGAAARTLSFRQPAESGLNYLRLRSTASSTDAAGFLVESVRVTVE